MPVRLLFGRTRAARRRGALALAPAGARPSLTITRATAERDRVLEEAPGPLLPAVATLADLVADLVRRFVDGPPPPGEARRRVLAWRLVGDPEVARELAEVERAMGAHGRLPADARVRAQVLALRAAVGPAPEDRLREALRRPTRALDRWLRRDLVFADLSGLAPRDVDLAIALAAAVDGRGGTAVFTFPIGRDRGGAEVAVALGVEPPEDREGRVFEATRSLRTAVFEAFVAAGDADVAVAGPLGVRPVDPADLDDGPAGAADLADHLAAGLPWSGRAPAWRIGAFPDPEREAEAAAREVAALLAAGVAPREVTVAVGDPGRLASVARVLADHGVPASWRAPVGARPDVVAWLRDPDPDHPPAGLAREVAEVREALGGEPDADLARALYADAFAAAGLRGDDRRGVSLLPLRHLAGAARHTFVLGLSAGVWPLPRGRSFLLSDEEARPLRDPLAEARLQLHGLLRDAVGARLHLSWPEAVGGRASRPSPVLAELLDVPVGDRPLREALAHEAPPRVGSFSRARAAAALAYARGGEAPAGRDAEVAAVALSRRGEPAAYDGILGHPLPVDALPVTALERYLRCPFRWWAADRLALAEPDPDAAELAPRRRGTAVHAILERFLRSRNLAPLAGDADPATAAALHATAVAVLDEVEAEGGFEPLFQRYARARWLAGLVDPRPAGLLRAWLDHERAAVGHPLDVERRFGGLRVGPITLRGTLDRVDRLPGGGLLVLDYKTGRAATRDEVLAGLALQPVAYLASLAAEGPVASAFLVLSRPDRLRRTGFVGDADALDLAAGSARRAAATLDAAARRRVLDAAGRRAEALRRGEVPPTPHEPAVAGCPTCAYRHACRRDPRHRAVDAGDAATRDPGR